MEREDEDIDEPAPRDPDEIEMYELTNALCGLTMLGDDPFLRMQATNIALIDKWLMSLEIDALRASAQDERPDMGTALFLNAHSQMWLFALYELLRTWRQERAKQVQKWMVNGGLPQKIAALRKDAGFLHVSNAIFASQRERIEADPTIMAAIADDLARTHCLFGQLEYLRVALAKHQVSGHANHMAVAPGYARVDMWTGSMSYQLSNGRVILDEVTRRSFADGLRHLIADRSVPSADDLAAFDAMMKVSPSYNPFED